MSQCAVCDRLYELMEPEYIRSARLAGVYEMAELRRDVRAMVEMNKAIRDCDDNKAILRAQRDEHIRESHSPVEVMEWYGGAA